MRARTLLAIVIALAVSATLVWNASQAAFTGTTDSSGNSVGSGTVVLGDNDAGSALFTMTNAKPGDSQTKCVNVSYTGTLGAQVRLRTAGVGTLAPYLTLTVTRGTFSSVPASGLCTTFTGDSANYAGAGAGVVYSGLLSAFPTTWAAGLVDPSTTTSPTAEVWTTSEAHAYQLTVTVNDDNNAQNKTSAPTFTWEARDAGDAAAGSYYAQAVLADNPASFWRLNETVGTTANDLGVSNYDGTYINGVTLNQPGPLEDGAPAATFDDVDDLITVGDVYDFAGTAAFSVEFWIRMPSVIAGWPSPISKRGYSPDEGWQVQLRGGSNELQFVRWRNSSQDFLWTSPVTPRRWHHVAATYDGTNMRIYLDGNLDGTTPSSQSIVNNAGGLFLGAGPASLADFAIYNYALSTPQVQAHYNARN